MKIVTADQMRRIEDRSEAAGVSKDALLERAGLETARHIRRLRAPLFGETALILAGPGNNGADGIVAARHLHRWGAQACVYICRDRRTPDPKLDAARAQGVPIITAADDPELAQLRRMLDRAHLVVDAALGIGRIRPLAGTMRSILRLAADAKMRRPDMTTVALDVPSGMDADSGGADPACPPADITLAMGYPKVGHFAYTAAAHVGKLQVVDIGLPGGVDGDVPLELMTAANMRPLLPHRPTAAHKGSFGKAMVVAGSQNYIGAAYLAGSAAARIGSGLVTIALPASIQAAIAASAAEPTYLPLAESSPGVVIPDAADGVLNTAADYDSLLIGCGMGQAADTRRFIETLLYDGANLPPIVIDADALNTLAQSPNWWERLAHGRSHGDRYGKSHGKLDNAAHSNPPPNTHGASRNNPQSPPHTPILTPHPGEMARLTGTSIAQIQANRIGAATDAAVRWNAIVVLKGAHTIAAFPDGRALISPFANPGLATAGTGDVLAGSIAGLLAQGAPSEDAAALGVYLHGLAGERVRAELGDGGMLAGDLLPKLPLAIRALGGGNAAADYGNAAQYGNAGRGGNAAQYGNARHGSSAAHGGGNAAQYGKSAQVDNAAHSAHGAHERNGG